jgi:hypothetical protein
VAGEAFGSCAGPAIDSAVTRAFVCGAALEAMQHADCGFVYATEHFSDEQLNAVALIARVSIVV